jgi:hypothetical protein
MSHLGFFGAAQTTNAPAALAELDLVIVELLHNKEIMFENDLLVSFAIHVREMVLVFVLEKARRVVQAKLFVDQEVVRHELYFDRFECDRVLVTKHVV